jgi:hypothetical protein
VRFVQDLALRQIIGKPAYRDLQIYFSSKNNFLHTLAGKQNCTLWDFARLAQSCAPRYSWSPQQHFHLPMPAIKLTSTTKNEIELKALPARSDSNASAAAQGL